MFPRLSLAFALFALASCASSGHSKVDATSGRLDQLRANVETLKTQVSATAESLSAVVAKAKTNPTAEYDNFARNAKAVESSYKSAQSRLTEAKASGEKMFADWTANTQSIVDEDLKKRSEEQRNDLKETLDDVVAAGDKALEETKAFVASSNDLVTYLKQDLTPAGIEAIEGKAKSHSKAASSIKDALDDVIEEATEASSKFATAKAPAK